MNEKVGKIIKKIRWDHGYTQVLFAEKVLGISQRQLRNIENGVSKISLESFIKIHNYFDLSISESIEQLENNDFLTSLYEQLHIPSKTNTYEIRQKILDIRKLDDTEKITLSTYEITTLEMIESFLLYKENEDLDFLKYFNEQNLEFVTVNLRAINLLLPLATATEISAIVTAIEKYEDKIFIRNKNYIISTIFLNAIGHLLSKENIHAPTLTNLLQKAKIYVKKANAMTLYPIYYRHEAHFYFLINDDTNSNASCQKALLFAEEVSEEIVQSIQDDVKEWRRCGN